LPPAAREAVKVLLVQLRDETDPHKRNEIISQIGRFADDARACSAIAAFANELDDLTLSLLPYQSPRWAFDDDAIDLLINRAIHERPIDPAIAGRLRSVVAQMFPACERLVDTCLAQPIRKHSMDALAICNAINPYLKPTKKRTLSSTQLDLLEARAPECDGTSAHAMIVDCLRVHRRPALFEKALGGSEWNRYWTALHVVEKRSLKSEGELVKRCFKILETLAKKSDDDIQHRAEYAVQVNKKKAV
jgi:hypothetical protein